MSVEKIEEITESMYERMDNGSLNQDLGDEIAADVLKFMAENNMFVGTDLEESAKEDGEDGDMESYIMDNYGAWEWADHIAEISEANQAKVLAKLEELNK